MEHVYIEGEKIYLRSITMDDSAQVIRWRNSDFVRQYFLIQKEFTMESQKKWMREVVEPGKTVLFIFGILGENRDIGSVNLKDIDHENRKAEYGIFIGEEDCLGKGYGTEAAKLVTEYGFEKLHLHKIYLQVIAENERARKSYQHAGFIKEAVLKDEVFQNGSFHDVIRMIKISENQDE